MTLQMVLEKYSKHNRKYHVIIMQYYLLEQYHDIVLYRMLALMIAIAFTADIGISIGG